MITQLPQRLLAQIPAAYKIEVEPYKIAWQDKRFYVRVVVHSAVGIMGEHRLEFAEASVLIRILRDYRFGSTKVEETGLCYERLTDEVF